MAFDWWITHSLDKVFPESERPLDPPVVKVGLLGAHLHPIPGVTTNSYCRFIITLPSVRNMAILYT